MVEHWTTKWCLARGWWTYRVYGCLHNPSVILRVCDIWPSTKLMVQSSLQVQAEENDYLCLRYVRLFRYACSLPQFNNLTFSQVTLFEPSMTYQTIHIPKEIDTPILTKSLFSRWKGRWYRQNEIKSPKQKSCTKKKNNVSHPLVEVCSTEEENCFNACQVRCVFGNYEFLGDRAHGGIARIIKCEDLRHRASACG